MKKTLVIVLTILAMSVAVYSQAKIGVINPQKVVTETIRGKQVKAKLEKLGEEKQQKIKGMEDAIKKLEKELMSPALNADAKEKKAVDLQSKRVNLKRFVEDAQKEFQGRYQKEMQTMYKEIMPIIEKIGAAKSFTIIFDLSNSGISYFDKTIDITNEVIKAYDQKYSK
jgi:outer membrane protein